MFYLVITQKKKNESIDTKNEMVTMDKRTAFDDPREDTQTANASLAVTISNSKEERKKKKSSSSRSGLCLHLLLASPRSRL